MKSKTMFDFWKVLRKRKKYDKENHFLILGFIMKNMKETKIS